MINAPAVRAQINAAQTVDDFMAADALLRGNEKDPAYNELLALLNARSASQMFAIKGEIERSSNTGSFMREAAALRAAGYPEGSQHFAAIRNATLTNRGIDPDTVLADAQLTEDEQNALLRLNDVLNNPMANGRFEGNWTDMRLAPTARMAAERLRRRVDEIAMHEGSELYGFFLNAVQDADRAAALDVLMEESSVLPHAESQLIREAIKMRRTLLSGEAFARIVEQFGWKTVQALYAGGDITHSLQKSDLVAEFTQLMAAVQAPVQQIAAVDGKLAERITRATWERSGERLSERKTMDEARRKIAERLAAV